jgi:signal transduction histidine kinase
MESNSDAGVLVPLGDFLTAEDPVWVWDAADLRILWANKAGREFWGADSVDALRAMRFNPRNKSARRMVALAEKPGSVREWVETLTLAAASGRRAVKCHMQSLQIAGGRPGLIVKALDETQGRDRHAAEPAETKAERSPPQPRRAATADKTALAAIAARLRQAASLSEKRKTTGRPAPQALPPPGPALDPVTLQIRELCHELRNPLTVISGFAERIRDNAPPGRQQAQLVGYAGDILESARLALAILSDFSGRMLRPDQEPARPDPADIRATIESCLRLIAPLARQAGIKLSRRTASGLPRLEAGERVLKQILLNLLMNAVRHQKTGGKIHVSARLRRDGAVRLTVADDGKGMTKKEIRAIMAPPRRASPPPPAHPGSSGIGLPLVKRFVESAGGALSIDSARGAGTTVAILFPPAP